MKSPFRPTGVQDQHLSSHCGRPMRGRNANRAVMRPDSPRHKSADGESAASSSPRFLNQAVRDSTLSLHPRSRQPERLRREPIAPHRNAVEYERANVSSISARPFHFTPPRSSPAQTPNWKMPFRDRGDK